MKSFSAGFVAANVGAFVYFPSLIELGRKRYGKHCITKQYYSPLLWFITERKRSSIMFWRSMSLSISIYSMQNVTMSAGAFRLCPYALLRSIFNIRIDFRVRRWRTHGNCFSFRLNRTEKHAKTFLSIHFNRTTHTFTPNAFIETNNRNYANFICTMD